MIGEGSYGIVFRAICKKTGEERAIKVLKTRFMKEAQMKDFFAEITMLSKLSHPSIVTLYNLFLYEKKYYVVMEYCNGSSVI
jgi:calcium-dependent protein kinase